MLRWNVLITSGMMTPTESVVMANIINIMNVSDLMTKVLALDLA
jgi:hypothetical protein